MKTNRLLSLVLALVITASLFAMPTHAAEDTCADIEIVIENENISEETKAKIIAYYSDPDHNHEDDGAATYGLTCTLFGHKLETSTVKTTTHKARTTAPRCLQKTYQHDACTRCDYEFSTLVASQYIYCCA